VAAAFLFIWKDGGDEQSDEDQCTDLFKASGFSGMVVNLFSNNLRSEDTVKQPAGRQ
jgi:hypothetical protein